MKALAYEKAHSLEGFASLIVLSESSADHLSTMRRSTEL